LITAYRLVHRVALGESPDPFRPLPHANRWNSADLQVAYTAENVALAALEIMAHLGPRGRSMSGYQLFSISFADDDFEDATTQAPDIDTQDGDATTAYGDTWAKARRSLALRVPSVVVPLSFNYIINPAHPRMSATTVQTHGAFEYDERIVRLAQRSGGL